MELAKEIPADQEIYNRQQWENVDMHLRFFEISRNKTMKIKLPQKYTGNSGEMFICIYDFSSGQIATYQPATFPRYILINLMFIWIYAF